MKDFEDSFNIALNYAFNLLSYRDRSQKELFERLIQKGFDEDSSKRVVDYLLKKGFVDDRRLAEVLKRNAIENKHLGKRGVKNYLINRGIEREIVNEVLGGEDNYYDTARRLVEKKLRHFKDTDNETTKKRLYGLLLRRGFSCDIVRKVLREFNLTAS